LITAWQYELREKSRASDQGDLFGRWWEELNLDIQSSTVQRITPDTAKQIILKYEWLGTMPPFIQDCFGLYFEGPLGLTLGGAIVFSQRLEANLKDAEHMKKTVIPPEAVYLSRGACAWWTPKNSASYMIANAAKQMGNVSVLAYADPDAGEVGSIYQALNWVYVGPTKDHSDPSGFYVDGKFRSTRDLKMYSTKRVQAAYPQSEVKASARKHRYLGIYGDKRWRKSMSARMEPHALPYMNRYADE
tara:strand:- start:1613 stop:2350 length:738 start_codon:yes stop_codon:yes gene_type:complete